MALTRPKASQIVTTIAEFSDPLVLFNKDQTGTNDKDIGLVFERGSDTNVAIFWDESADQFVLVNTTDTGSTNGNVSISSYADLQVSTINTATLEIGGTEVTATAAELNILDGVTATAAELNILDGVTATTTELNYTDGVTSNIQTQLNAKAPTASPTFTGNATFDTNTFYVDGTNNRVGIGTTSPAYQVEIENTGANALLVLDRTDGAGCFIEGQATRSAFGSIGATPLALAYNSLAVVTIGAGGAITVNPDGGSPFTFPTADGSANQVLATDGSGNISFVDISTTLGIAGDSGTDTVSLLNDTLTFSGTANEITTAITDNTVTVSLPDDVTIGDTLTVTGNLFVDTNTLYVDATNNAVGIGTSSPNTYGTTVSSGDIATLARGVLKFYDTDSTHYVGFRSASTVTSNVTWTLPASDGSSGQVLSTDGSGNLSWATGSAGASTGYQTSTVTTIYGADGNNYDLAEGPNQDGDETPFSTSGTDAFGVSLGTVYDSMEPIGSTITLDYADGEAYVGA